MSERARPAPLGLCLLALLLAAGAASARASTATGATRRIVVYSFPVAQQFIDNNDDEARGDVNNPFGTQDAKAAAISDEHSDGPYPGDETLFSFNIYASASFKQKLGTAVYTCQYYFARDAFCDASFELGANTLIGAGTLNFDGQRFALAITGGAGAYDDASGDVEASPVGKQAQRLTFELV